MELSDDEKEEEGTECGEITEIVHKLKDQPSSSSNIVYSVETDEAGRGDCAGTNLDQSVVMLIDEEEVSEKETIDENESNDAVELIEIKKLECNEGQASEVDEKLDEGESININKNSDESIEKEEESSENGKLLHTADVESIECVDKLEVNPVDDRKV